MSRTVFREDGKPYQAYEVPTLRRVQVARQAEPPFDPASDAHVRWEPDAAVFVPRIGARLLPACISIGEAWRELIADRATAKEDC